MIATNTTLILEDDSGRADDISRVVGGNLMNTTCRIVTNVADALREIMMYDISSIGRLIINPSVPLESGTSTITSLPPQAITGKCVSDIFTEIQTEKPGKRLSIPDFFDILRVLYPDLLTRQALIPCLPVLLNGLSPKANEQAQECGENMYGLLILTRKEIGGEKDEEVVQNFLAQKKR